MSLRDFPLLYDKKGGSLKISFNRRWFCLRYHFSLSICIAMICLEGLIDVRCLEPFKKLCAIVCASAGWHLVWFF